MKERKMKKMAKKKQTKNPRFTYSVCGPFTKNSKIYANMEYRLYLQEWSSSIKLVFNMIWLMVKTKILLKEDK